MSTVSEGDDLDGPRYVCRSLRRAQSPLQNVPFVGTTAMSKEEEGIENVSFVWIKTKQLRKGRGIEQIEQSERQVKGGGHLAPVRRERKRALRARK
jgi:hypothetical protein